MNKIYKILIPLTGVACWSILGFKRGIQSYEYTYNKRKDISTRLYSTKIMHGLLGSIIYINPVLICRVLLKEIYRAEVNIRDLEDEKNTDYYNEIL